MILYANITLGWSPIFALVVDGSRIVQQVTGWTGGTGDAPATGLYVGATGFVSLIADAVDVRGSTGATGAGVATGGTANQALTKINGTDYNTQWETIDKTFVGLGNVPNTDATNASNISSGTLADARFTYVKSMFGGSFPGTNSIAASTTQYLSPLGGTSVWNNENVRSYVVPVSGVVKTLYVTTTSTQSATGSLVITLRKNSVNQTVTITVAAGDAAQTYSDLAHSFSVTAGDVLTVQGVNNATATSANIGTFAFIITNN